MKNYLSKKILMLAICIAMMLAISTGCKDEPMPIKPIPPEPENNSLVGGYWKLVGYYDIEKDTLIKPILHDCDDLPYPGLSHFCEFFYTLEFWQIEENKTTKVVGRMINKQFGGRYTVDYSNSTISMNGDYPQQAYDIYDGESFLEALRRTKSFELKNNELKLYSFYCLDCLNFDMVSRSNPVCNHFPQKIYLQFRRVNNE